MALGEERCVGSLLVRRSLGDGFILSGSMGRGREYVISSRQLYECTGEHLKTITGVFVTFISYVPRRIS